MVIFSREGICRGLIHYTLLAIDHAGRIEQRFNISSNIANRQQGVMELDPYSRLLPSFDTILQFSLIVVLCILSILFIILIINLLTFYRLRPHTETHTSEQLLISILVPGRRAINRALCPFAGGTDIRQVRDTCTE